MRCTICIQFVMNQQSLHVSSTPCPSSGGKKGKGHPITGHEGPRGGVEV
jgi:hypothetical protein